MDEDDFLHLVALLTEQLQQIGHGDIAEERHYLRADADDDEAVLIPPQELLIEMLAAFERRILTEDIGTYNKSIRIINENTDGSGPDYAEIEIWPTASRGVSYQRISDHSTDLREVLDDIHSLRAKLIEARRTPGMSF
ncbi:hypothetical protein [Segnochrobactrum spirostomi]|uniref:Uncharacterized protein n=1 Tax=Segnochrobactrum spirostomi TaxID=2608987 RepID=A0A6A7Y307_9HYPH|nr:hypothetical protein [Segnochrobactrum spirostomi]MQT13443.1 hypothetical protein [Segnochrobactrum spirostomi]